ncbi:hypothetical protein CVT24_010309 [Panaeolus cyanescens]|uniref:Uncharacterized protein n=1 Tax=Panaeolus cyanescens TaxID=181874 RepID=A0A409VAJ6_9AGAR|nr:hypothetical protein CVT24_010309 [Panaeolus cyanescens]
MALAQRLNELALANSQGLLNDDEYRMLRQDVFEKYSASATVPVESPVVPVTRVHVQLRSSGSSSSSSSPPKPVSKSQAKPDPIIEQRRQSKSTVGLGVANLLRRATGRKTPTPRDPPEPRRPTLSLSTPTDSPRRNQILPRMLQSKKHHEPQRPHTHYSSSDELAKPSSFSSRLPQSPGSSSSTRRLHHVSPIQIDRPLSTVHDVFDEVDLTTAKDIRKAIAITESEAQRIIEAFRDLEANTLRRIQKQRAYRLPLNPPSSVDVLLEGREWREHKLSPSPSSPLFDLRQRHAIDASDGMSTRSGSSNRTTLSQSRSIASLPRQALASPLSPHFRSPSMSLHRKNSTSSVSSHATSLTNGLLSVSNSSAMTRSSSHLPLRNPKGNPTEPNPESPAEDQGGDDDPELLDIRHRCDEVVARYTARLEFLRAKLKTAELHEKLMRK